MPITRTQHEAVAVLAIDMGRGNAINHTFIDALGAALGELERDPEVRALVLTGHGRAFCAGLDLVESYDLDRSAVERFVDAFDGLFARVAAFPWPAVAAINGHAIAGGCIIAMATDYRLMSPGPFRIGVNEVALGIPFPSAAFEIARRGAPPSAWAEALFEGRLYRPDEARGAGLIHEVATSDLLSEAVGVARRLSSGAPGALRATKAELVAPLLAAIEANREARRARFLEAWSGGELRERVGRVREELLRKSAPPTEPGAGI
ncbi:MAG TPA: enoyl-CoA hydratase/isomerase family protein [Candidatus Nanopelagicales bacterium]|nr:enoyl-CoA hydratase/isomerase family protein [Candidatus Nanopelagicales bacterium]